MKITVALEVECQEYHVELCALIKREARKVGRQAAFNQVLENENFHGDRQDIRLERELIKKLLGSDYRGINAHEI